MTIKCPYDMNELLSYIMKDDCFSDNPDYYKPYIEETLRIFRSLERQGFKYSLIESYEIWSAYSLDMDAGWLCLPEKDCDLDNCVKRAIQIYEKKK